MKSKRDMSLRQFQKKCKDYGFKPQGFMGYYRLNIPSRDIHVSVLNAGKRLRDQLAYLIQQQEKANDIF